MNNMNLRRNQKKLVVFKVVRRLQHSNPVRAMCDHLLGEDHSLAHRLVVGFVVIMLGVSIAQGAHSVTTVWFVQHLIDAGGYGLHGVGLMPYLELIQNWRENKDDNGRKAKGINKSQGDRSSIASDEFPDDGRTDETS